MCLQMYCFSSVDHFRFKKIFSEIGYLTPLTHFIKYTYTIEPHTTIILYSFSGNYPSYVSYLYVYRR